MSRTRAAVKQQRLMLAMAIQQLCSPHISSPSVHVTLQWTGTKSEPALWGCVILPLCLFPVKPELRVHRVPAWLLPGCSGEVWGTLQHSRGCLSPGRAPLPQVPHSRAKELVPSFLKKVSSGHLQLAGLQVKFPKQINRDVMIHREDKMQCQGG